MSEFRVLEQLQRDIKKKLESLGRDSELSRRRVEVEESTAVVEVNNNPLTPFSKGEARSHFRPL